MIIDTDKNADQWTIYKASTAIGLLLEEVIHTRKLLARIAIDENITIVGYMGTRYTPDWTNGTEEEE